MIKIFLTFLKLGLTSFGGPVAHIGYFHQEFVARKKWISEHEYADLVALCQFLPGPASSQVGMGIGYYRGGVIGSVLAWIAFTLPSALLLVMLALGLNSLTSSLGSGWLHGLKIAAVAVVAQAVFEMAKKFSAGAGKLLVTIMSAAFCIYIQNIWVQVGLIMVGAIAGVLFFKTAGTVPHQPRVVKHNHLLSSVFLVLFFTFLVLLPIAAVSFDSLEMKMANVFYHLGALVFGGGHVVLPLIQTSVVDAGWATKEAFIAGYGAAQAVPGPLFSLSAYLGYLSGQWQGAVIALVMIFLPSFLLVVGVLPFWEKIRSFSHIKKALVGINAVVVGLLLAALYDPVWTAAIFDWQDILLAAIAFALLTLKKVPSYIIVVLLAIVKSIQIT